MKQFVFRFLIVGFLLVTLGTGLAQFQKIKIKIPKKIPGLDKILKSKPPVTTSLSDAVTEVPFLDDFELDGATPMSVLPRTSEGGFILDEPGNYIFEAQSYCMGPGKYSPSDEVGYLYAPLKGRWADIVRNILQRSVNHSEIPQRDIQFLLWAIVSRTKISSMSRDMQLTAAKLLTPKELFRINEGALGLIPKSLMEEAFENLPPVARQVLEAEARLREMLTKAQATYEEVERVAVLQGDPPNGEGSREVPRGRWSLHPDGYFIRYFPRGYTQILIELYMPELFQIERDEKGRITLIADDYGNRIETKYDDTIEPLSIHGEPLLKGYAFRSIRFESLDPKNPREKLRTEWSNIGWAFLGVPTGGGSAGTSSGRFSGLEERYEWCKRHKKELDNLYGGLKKLSERASPQRMSQDDIEKIMALGHYAIALKKTIGNTTHNTDTSIADQIGLVKKAWQSFVSKYMGAYKAKSVFNPASDPASGNTSEQPTTGSGRSTDEDDSCAEAFKKCLTEALDDYSKCTGECMSLDGEPAQKSCMKHCENIYKLEKKGCRYKAQECLEK
jgi:hypothetical protein